MEPAGVERSRTQELGDKTRESAGRTGDGRVFTAEGDEVMEGPFSGGELNPELVALGRAVVAELNEDSAEGLEALLVEKADYQRVFPELAANPLTSKIGWELSWADMTAETKDEIRTILDRDRGGDLVFVDLTVQTVVERQNVRLYRRATLEVRDGENGKKVSRLGILGTVVEERESGDLWLLSYRLFSPSASAGEENNEHRRSN